VVLRKPRVKRGSGMVDELIKAKRVKVLVAILQVCDEYGCELKDGRNSEISTSDYTTIKSRGLKGTTVLCQGASRDLAINIGAV
jgi:hypothetical protein